MRNFVIINLIILVSCVALQAFDKPTVPYATSTRAGKVKPDGTSITVGTKGVISATAAPIATDTTVGTVKPDGNTTIVDENGAISAIGEIPAAPVPFSLLSSATDPEYVKRPTDAVALGIPIFANSTGNRLQNSYMTLEHLQTNLGTIGTAGRYCIEESMLGTHSLGNCTNVVAAGTCSTTYLVDAALGNMFNLTLNGACAIGSTGLVAGQEFSVLLSQSGTAAPIFANTVFYWAGGVMPTWSTSAGKKDMFTCKSFDGTKLICSAIIDAAGP